MHQVELDGTRKYSKRSICSGAEGLRLNSQSEVEEVTCNCTRMHAPTRIDCLPIHFSAAEEVVTMLPTAAATPGRPTAATGINASSSVAISQRLCPRLKPACHLRQQTGIKSIIGIACTMGQPLAMPTQRLIMCDRLRLALSVCLPAREGNTCVL